MPKESAGLLLYRRVSAHPGYEVLLVHPGGPFWAKKDRGAWTVPKGGLEPGEDPLAAARRELREETGFVVNGPFVSLDSIRQAGGKVVRAFAVEADVDATALVSNRITLVWPPRSGRTVEFPEIDRGAWFTPAEAAEKINAAQVPLLQRLAVIVGDERAR